MTPSQPDLSTLLTPEMFGIIAAAVAALPTALVLGVLVFLMRDIKNDLRSWRTEVKADIGRLDDKIDRVVGGLNDKIDRDVGGLNDKIDRAVETLNDKIDRDVGGLNDKIDRAVETLNDKIDRAVETLNDKIDRAVDALNQRIDHVSANLNDKIESATMNLGGQIEAQRAESESLARETAEIRGALRMPANPPRQISRADELAMRKTQTPTKVAGKYGPLARRLAEETGHRCTLTFTEIDQLVDGLPDSAHTHRPWWANDQSHAQARAWMATGWKVAEGGVKLGDAVVFERNA